MAIEQALGTAPVPPYVGDGFDHPVLLC